MSARGRPGPDNPARRALLARLALGAGVAPLLATAIPTAHAAASAADLPLLQESDMAAQATHYVSDARRAKGAQAGATCANCELYGPVNGAAGTCSLLPGNLVSAGGWCSAWASL